MAPWNTSPSTSASDLSIASTSSPNICPITSQPRFPGLPALCRSIIARYSASLVSAARRTDHRGQPVLERDSPADAGSLAEVLQLLEEGLGCQIGELFAGHGLSNATPA